MSSSVMASTAAQSVLPLGVLPLGRITTSFPPLRSALVVRSLFMLHGLPGRYDPDRAFLGLGVDDDKHASGRRPAQSLEPSFVGIWVNLFEGVAVVEDWDCILKGDLVLL